MKENLYPTRSVLNLMELRSVTTKFFRIMKTLQLSVFFTMFVLFTVSCNSLSSEEKEIVGKYYMSVNEENGNDNGDPVMVVSIEGTQEYRKDKTLSMDFMLKILIEAEDYDYFNIITVEYRIQAEGAWTLERKTLTERCDPQSVRFDFVRSKATDKDEVAQYLIKGIKQYADAYMAEMKKELSNTSYTIISQTDREMVLEDEDGNEETYIRI